MCRLFISTVYWCTAMQKYFCLLSKTSLLGPLAKVTSRGKMLSPPFFKWFKLHFWKKSTLHLSHGSRFQTLARAGKTVSLSQVLMLRQAPRLINNSYAIIVQNLNQFQKSIEML